jgi:5-methylcytosine-specific restriction endonuclease McrA
MSVRRRPVGNTVYLPNKNTHHYVKINGTAAPKYSSSSSKRLNDGSSSKSWVDTWRDSTGSKRTQCAKLGCSDRDLVGGHVISIDQRRSKNWQLVPICRSCNNKANTEPMRIVANCPLVSVGLEKGKHVVQK